MADLVAQALEAFENELDEAEAEQLKRIRAMLGKKTLKDLVIVLKGGPGSGHWGHVGRPGQRGGSRRFGGLAAIGATSDTRLEKRRALAKILRRDRRLAQAEINKVADELGYPREKIIYAGEGHEFTVGGDKYIAGGTYDPVDGTIRLYSGAFPQTVAGPVSKGLVAHEVAHNKWHKFLDKRQEQNREVVKRLEEEGKRGVHYSESFMRPDGKFRSRADARKYAAVAALDDIMQSDEQLRKMDGVTPYSRSYWKAFENKSTTDNYYKAVNETLAEVTRLRLNHGDKATREQFGVSARWVNLQDRVAKLGS
jgi:hypothetical protein